MKLHEIKNWLLNPERNYKTGLEIYNAYKSNNKFDNYFNVESPSSESMQFKMLVQRVGEIHRKLEQNPNLIKSGPITVKPINTDELKKKFGERVSQLDPKRPRVVDNPLIDISQLPEDLQRLYLENKNLTKEIGQLHQELKAVPAGEKYNAKRKTLADKITTKDDKRAENWSRIDTWWKENKLTTDQQRQEFDAKKDELKISLKEAKSLFNRIDTLKINITREEKRMKGNALLTEKLTPKVNKWRKELAELEAKVK